MYIDRVRLDATQIPAADASVWGAAPGWVSDQTAADTSALLRRLVWAPVNLTKLLIIVAQSVQWPGYGLDDRVTIPSREGIFVIARASRSALGHAHPPNQCTEGSFQGVKRPGREANHPSKEPRLRIVQLYLQCPIRLHGVVLS